MAKKLEEVFEERYKNCPTGDEIADVLLTPSIPRPATSHPPAGMLVHHTPSQV
jgi:hypothetical protein